MAKFNAGTSGLKQVETDSGLASLGDSISAVDLDTNKKGQDYLGDMKAAVEAAKNRQSGKGSDGLEIAAVDFGSIANLARLSGADRLIQEAKEFFEKEEYQQALDTLELALKEEPNHSEGIYLQALCYFEIEADLEAAVTLSQLTGKNLEQQLQTRVNVLASKISDRIVVSTMTGILEAIILSETNTIESGIPKVRALVALQPRVGLYHQMLVRCLMMIDQSEEAIAAINHALQVASVEDRPNLEAHKQQIERRHLEKLLDPAIQHIKKRQFKQALIFLNSLESKCQSFDLYHALREYVQSLQGGFFSFLKNNKKGDLPAPPASDNQETIYFLLVGEEITQARLYMKNKQGRQAKFVLQSALPIAPKFPYLRYLLGCCIYQAVGEDVSAGKLKLEPAIAQLKDAQVHARIGARDSGVEDAQTLVKNIEDGLEILNRIRGEVQKQERMLKPLTEAMKEFQSIMKSAEGGISTPQQFLEIYNRMSKLKDQLPSIESGLGNSPAKETFDQLKQAVHSNFDQLETMLKQHSR